MFKFVRHIKDTSNIRDRDVAIFMAWMKKEFTTEECITRFRNNNRIKMEIDPEEFECWLRSLGYERKNDHE